MSELATPQSCPQCGFRLLDLGETLKSSNNYYERLPSPIEALLQNNESPPDSESSFVQNLLYQAEISLTDVDSQIERMQASISRLSERRGHITANIQAYRTVLHPLRRLPREVVLEIFEWCVGVNSIEPDSVVTDDPDLKLPGLRVVSSLSAGKAPWLLGQISRNWRAIALSSPKLWSSVSIFLRAQSQTSAAVQRRLELAQVSLLSLYLTRSHDYPLSLYVNSLYASHPLLSMLYSQSYRWRNAVLYLPAETLKDLSFACKGALPLLRNLLISITRDSATTNTAQQNWDEVINRDTVVDAFQFTPELKCLAISQIPSFPSLFVIPWAQLVRFECNLKSEAWQQSENSVNVDILRRASNVRMSMVRCNFSMSLNPVPLLHVNLHTLNLFSVLDTNPCIPHVAQFLDIVTLPSLRQLTIRTQRREIDNSSAVLRFIERSEPKCLRVVSLNDMPMSVEATQQLLTLIPQVEHLGLSGVTDDIVRALYRGSDVHPDVGQPGFATNSSSKHIGVTLLPRLKRLAFFGGESLSVNQRLLLGMIESRRRDTMSESLISNIQDSNGEVVPTLRLERMELSRKFNFNDPDAIFRLDQLLGEGLILDQR